MQLDTRTAAALLFFGLDVAAAENALAAIEPTDDFEAAARCAAVNGDTTGLEYWSSSWFVGDAELYLESTRNGSWEIIETHRHASDPIESITLAYGFTAYRYA